MLTRRALFGCFFGGYATGCLKNELSSQALPNAPVPVLPVGPVWERSVPVTVFVNGLPVGEVFAAQAVTKGSRQELVSIHVATPRLAAVMQRGLPLGGGG